MIEHKPKHFTPTFKLIRDKHNKKEYLVHYRNLKFYVRMGMIIEKIHKIISFKQSFWLKKYITLCSTKSALSKADSEIAFYKNLALSFFGKKKMENTRNCVDVHFVPNYGTENLIGAQSKLSFDGIHQVYEKFTSNMFKNQILKKERPIYLGFCILNLSKLLRYETYYDKFQQD